jgi:type II secretory pathway pseudopilin PulG
MKSRLKRSSGFTLIEFAIGFSVIGIIFAVTVPAHIAGRDFAKECETKANLHTIQAAVERYGVDHKEYPAYILGGDPDGWAGCRSVTSNPSLTMHSLTIHDDLLDGGYLGKYPRNAFLNPGDGCYTTVRMTGISGDPGMGDPRFGYLGERMGNCLDDPRLIFTGDYNSNSPLAETIYAPENYMLGVVNQSSPNTFYCMGGVPEWSANADGQSDLSATPVKYYWPGEFFYRSGGLFDIGLSTDVSAVRFSKIFGWDYVCIDKYMLGAYGSLRTDGLDVIRLTAKSGQTASTMDSAMQGFIYDEYYQDHSNLDREASHPDFDCRVMYSNPEVFGGGERGLMPQFPYFESFGGEWIYGAPDGFPDGIVLVLTGEIPVSIIDIGVLEPSQ